MLPLCHRDTTIKVNWTRPEQPNTQVNMGRLVTLSLIITASRFHVLGKRLPGFLARLVYWANPVQGVRHICEPTLGRMDYKEQRIECAM